MVDSVARGKYDSRMVKDGNLLLSELLWANTLDFYKLLKIDIYTILSRNVKIGRFV